MDIEDFDFGGNTVTTIFSGDVPSLKEPKRPSLDLGFEGNDREYNCGD